MEFSDLIFHEKLGEGGYGVVHRVTFKTPQPGIKQAAAKRLNEADLKEEVDILKTLEHPNVVKLYGCLEGPASMYFILLEYAQKGTVRGYLEKHQGWPTPIHLLKKWARESALALQFLHHHRVLHRDVKASNCLLFEGDLLKLSDFGLSREMDESETTSTAKGTWRYMAPEIHTDHHFSFKTDVYAYGMLILEMGTGKAPFDGMESMHVVYRVGMENLKPAIPPYFPDMLADLVWRCWNRSPQHRPALTEALEVIDGKSFETLINIILLNLTIIHVKGSQLCAFGP